MGKLTREQVMPIIERLGGIGDKGWTFSEMGLMALISEVEDLVGKPKLKTLPSEKILDLALEYLGSYNKPTIEFADALMKEMQNTSKSHPK